jgi:hypothetical protein
MSEFFEPSELLEAGYIEEDECRESTFASINAEVI